MNTPNPQIPPPAPTPPQSSGWTPTTSTMGGAILGGALGTLVTAIVESVYKQKLDSTTVNAISTVCIFAVGYFFKDGGRK